MASRRHLRVVSPTERATRPGTRAPRLTFTPRPGRPALVTNHDWCEICNRARALHFSKPRKDGHEFEPAIATEGRLPTAWHTPNLPVSSRPTALSLFDGEEVSGVP